MHHPIFQKKGFSREKIQAKFSFVIQLLAGYIYVYVAVMAMSGAVSVGDVLMYSGAIITMMTGVQNILMQYNQINYRNEYLKTYEEFIKNSRFGCADCYHVFDPLLGEKIKKLQENSSHTGKHPKIQPRSQAAAEVTKKGELEFRPGRAD